MGVLANFVIFTGPWLAFILVLSRTEAPTQTSVKSTSDDLRPLKCGVAARLIRFLLCMLVSSLETSNEICRLSTLSEHKFRGVD